MQFYEWYKQSTGKGKIETPGESGQGASVVNCGRFS